MVKGFKKMYLTPIGFSYDRTFVRRFNNLFRAYKNAVEAKDAVIEDKGDHFIVTRTKLEVQHG